MKFLFLKKSLNWPRATGHDVHAYYLAQALAKLGHSIGLATVHPPDEKALAGLDLDAGLHSLASNSPSSAIRLSWLQRRFLRYWGIEASWITATANLVAAIEPDVVVTAGFDLVPCLAAVHGPTRVWYIADEYARHHLSIWRPLNPGTWRHLFEALVAAVYERAFAKQYDRAWAVSESEARAMRRIAAAPAADVVTNGVDSDWFAPGDEQRMPRSCVFWGRLDARPNIQAVEWFCREIWPALRRLAPDARFSIFGFAPGDAMLALARDGVTVAGDLPDLRSEIRKHEVAVMPFVSGGGIKNKLLEAAALGMPIVASPRACAGLDSSGGLPLAIARSRDQWIDAVNNLWSDREKREKLGGDARAWVLSRHTWKAAATAALAGLQRGAS